MSASKINFAQGNQLPGTVRGVYQHLILTTPSSSTPSVGSYFVIDLKQKNIQVHKLSLLFNVTSNDARPLTPCWSWFNHIDLVIGSTIVDTLYSDFNFIRAQTENVDADRTMFNYSAGNYLDLTSNANKWSDSSPHYATLNLNTFYTQGNVPILTTSNELQLRVYLNDASYWFMDPAHIKDQITINSCSLISSVTVIPDQGAQMEIARISKVPNDYMFSSTLHSIYNQVSGTSTANITLTSITGSVHAIYFTVRHTKETNFSNWYKFREVAQFEILSASGSNIVGGSPLLSDFVLLELGHKWFPGSSFTAEPFSGTNDSYVYCYSFSNDMRKASKYGGHHTTYRFIGSEQLKITFPRTLDFDIQIDVWAQAEAGVRLGATTVQKLLINY